MKKIFVTGADGFIGSHLVELLIEEGFEVTALCIYNSNGNWGWLENISPAKKNYINVIQYLAHIHFQLLQVLVPMLVLPQIIFGEG